MTVDEAADILLVMRRGAPRGEVAIQAILFGLKYHAQLRGVRLADIANRIGIGPMTCTVEIRHGMKLAKYVRLNDAAF